MKRTKNLFITIIEPWRAAWGYDFPFYYAQIAPWVWYGTDNVNCAVIRYAYRNGSNPGLIARAGFPASRFEILFVSNQ